MTSPAFNSGLITARLLAVARGDEAADVVLVGARVVNVFTRTLMERANIAIVDGRIAGIGDYTKGRVAIDLAHFGAGIVAPGFIDAHMHVESTMLPPSQFVRLATVHGSTGAVFDPHEIANVLGLAGIRWVMDDARGLPFTSLFALSSCVPSSPLETSGATLSAADLEPLFDDPRVVALAEMMNYPGVVHADPGVLAKVNLGLAHRIVDGHAPGLRAKALQAYVAAGISSDHECTTADEAAEKLALGMRILIREGSAAKNLEALLPLVRHSNAHRFCFCTDDRHPGDLQDEGHINHVVRRAIALGLDPMLAYSIGSHHTAAHYRRRDLGAIAPGNWANLIVLDDLETVHPRLVMHEGHVAARDGEYVFHLHSKDSGAGGTGVSPVPRSATADPYQRLAHTRPELGIHVRNLPHFERGGETYFVTFAVMQGELSPTERQIALDACKHWHGQRMELHAAVIMPDHVHLLLSPFRIGDDRWYSLSELLHSIKSFSSHQIGKARGAGGTIWQDENYDRIVRPNGEFGEKRAYIAENPVRGGLVTHWMDYPFTWVSDEARAGRLEFADRIRDGRHRRDACATGEEGESFIQRIDVRKPLRLPVDLSVAAFRIPASPDARLLRVIGMDPHQLVTASLRMHAKVEAGAYVADLDQDMLKLAVVERHTGSGRIGLGFVHGFGLKAGAIASTVGHDSHNLAIVGTNDADMLAAARALEACGGGQCAVRDGRVLETLPLPIAGLMSDQPAEAVILQQRALLKAARSLGYPHHDPFMPLSFLPLPVIPHLKLTDLGLVDVDAFRVVPLED